ncbi:lymphotactin-like isoform X2 [Rhineura floridana]|uniref:lymphotactin-like isoform X2 n=1 Tax=Rhineura floridana TaxID=261503 RepID=UPI002AC82800|nr:lymphotactin-like isoform X2 [Rhineura floridana]
MVQLEQSWWGDVTKKKEEHYLDKTRDEQVNISNFCSCFHFCWTSLISLCRGTFGSQTMPLNSCVDLHTSEINIKRIADYERQTIPVKAVIFITKNGVKVCVPYDLAWVKKNIHKLERSKARKQKRTTSRPKSMTS